MLNIILPIAILIVGVVFTLIFMAMYEGELKTCILQVGGLLYAPFNAIAQTCKNWHSDTMAWLRAQAVSHSTDSSQVIPAVIGAFIYMIMALGLILSEIPLASMTLEVWGFSSLNNSMKNLHTIDSGICVAIALLMAPVIWGLLFFDAICITHFAGCLTNRLGKIGRRILAVIAVVGFLCSLCSLVLMAYDRGTVIALGLTEPFDNQGGSAAQSLSQNTLNKVNDPLAALQQINDEKETVVSDFSAKIPVLVMTVITANIALLAAICLVPGLFAMLWTIFGTCLLLLLPLALVRMITTFLASAVSRLSDTFLAIFLLMVACGNKLANMFAIPISDGANNHSSRSTTANHKANQDSASDDRGSAAGFDPFA
jgi:hypothetical protein